MTSLAVALHKNAAYNWDAVVFFGVIAAACFNLLFGRRRRFYLSSTLARCWEESSASSIKRSVVTRREVVVAFPRPGLDRAAVVAAWGTGGAEWSRGCSSTPCLPSALKTGRRLRPVTRHCGAATA